MKDLNLVNLTFAAFFPLLRYTVLASLGYFMVHKVFMKYAPKRYLATKLPNKKIVLREIKNSLRSLAILAVFPVFLTIAKYYGYTKIYTDVSEYGVPYLIFSCVATLFIHDFYYYFLHRTMHHPKLYKTFHFEHHKSLNPTAYSAFSLSWQEAIVDAAFFPVLAFVMPLHPIALIYFLVSSVGLNVVGHLGYEIFPPSWIKAGLANSVTHHHMHHQTATHNFSLYFTIWDRVFGTMHPEYEEVFKVVTDPKRDESTMVELRDLSQKLAAEKTHTQELDCPNLVPQT